MKLISLQEFQRTAGLSDQALVWLLVNNRLRCQVDQSEGLMVDAESADTQALVAAITTAAQRVFASAQPVLQERVAGIIGRHLEEIIEEAVAIAQSSRT